MTNLQPFSKPALSLQEQLSLLQSRGLEIPDPEEAIHYLRFIGYYRFSGYTRPFQTGEEHQFKSGTTFSQILDLYIFDRKLRLLLMDAIERIEVAVRSILNNLLCLDMGPHWYLSRKAFAPNIDYAGLLLHLQEEMGFSKPGKREPFIAHYLESYGDPPYPPSWMVMETLSIGTVSRLYQGLADDYRKAVAGEFHLQHEILASILHALSHLRNLCAHHARVWNREYRIRPRIPKRYQAEFEGCNPRRLAAFVFVIELLLKQIAPGTEWRTNLDQLLNENPDLPRVSMGWP